MSSLDDKTLSALMSTGGYDGIKNLVSRELSEAVLDAMGNLKLKHRSILVLRCCEHLSHSEIAEVMDCSETAARMLFFRARRSLKKQLSKHGFNRKMWIPAMALFAHMTIAAKISSVAAATAATSSKAGMVTAIVAAAALTIGGIALLRSQVKSTHYVIQGRSKYEVACEKLVYFPEDVDGPVFRKVVEWDPKQTTASRVFLNNANGNYMHKWDDLGKETVIIYNWNVYRANGRTWRLPSDPPEFTEFLDEVEGPFPDITRKHHEETGLLISETDQRSEIKERLSNTEGFHAEYAYNKLTEGQFQYPNREGANVIDRRDAMHKRGWTYFRITGQINSEQVTGTGRIPFFYGKYYEYRPWLRLNIGDRLTIIDHNSGAYVADNQGNVIAAYPAETFFKGLSRPWFGFHTSDSIRRDAAKQRFPFELERLDNGKETVKYIGDADDQQIKVTCYVDIINDIVDWISFDLPGTDEDSQIGKLNFTYLQELDQPLNDFTEPTPAVPQTTQTESPGMLWLIELTQNN